MDLCLGIVVRLVGVGDLRLFWTLQTGGRFLIAGSRVDLQAGRNDHVVKKGCSLDHFMIFSERVDAAYVLVQNLTTFCSTIWNQGHY